MTPTEESLFLEALSLESPEAREDFLIRTCEQQPELLRNVRSLLNAYARGGFIENTLPEIAAAKAMSTHGGVETVIGPYNIRELIGRGGMGAVYLAEQLRPVRRKVAIKIIRPELDNQNVIRRFHQEQRTLALMDHPNIARVLDASVTESGVSYFVMELVSGTPILEYCEKEMIDVNQRLRLFVDVCQAIQHAHQKGIIHRDVKPSNVLITVREGVPVVKVIDFGIAKAFTEEDAETTSPGNTLITQLGEFLGTPQYMSPEQASMGELPVDTRTDIYSLGTLLYVLLTGVPPFDAARIKQASFDEVRQMIREVDPVLPSLRIRQRPGHGDTLITDHSARRRLLHRLTGDLDCIVMKAIDKDPARRYQTVSDLTEDVQCFLDSRPIKARLPTVIYSLSKLARRRRGMLISTVIAMICLLTGLMIAIVQERRAVGAEKRMARLLYAADIRVATQATIKHDSVVAREALARQIPAKSEEDLRSFDWYFLNARNKTETRDLLRTDKPLYNLCHIKGRGQIACCGEEGIVRILDETSGKLLLAITAGQGEVNGVAPSPDGSILASAGDDGTVAFWNVETGELISRFKAHQRQAFQVAWSPDGTQLATCGNERDAHVWSATDFKRLCTFPTESDLEFLAVSINGDLAIGMEGGNVALTHFPKEQGELPGMRIIIADSGEHCGALAFSPNGKLLASGVLSGKVNLHTIPKLERVKQITLADAVNSVTISADHRSCVAGMRNGAVSVVDLSDLEAIDPELINPSPILDSSTDPDPPAIESAFALVRYNADGSLDPEFDEDGVAAIKVLPGEHFVSRVVMQSDGKLLVSGSARNTDGHMDIVVARLERDGLLDPTFGAGGTVLVSAGASDDGSETLVIQDDGKILVGGFTNNGNNSDIVVLRLNPDGSFDHSFGDRGIVIKAIGASHEVCRGMAVQPDGKILLVGDVAGATVDMFMLRLNTDGTSDSTFDDDGLQTVDLGSTDIMQSVAVQSDGKLIGAGYAFNGTDFDFAMMRLNPDGSFDGTFDGDGDSDGKILSPVGEHSNDTASVLIVQPDGKLMMGGRMTTSSGDQFALVRYTGNGSLDPTFHEDGRQSVTVGINCNVFGLAVQSDGKLIQSGWSQDGQHQQFTVIRYTADGTLDSSFDGDGIVRTTIGTGESTGHWVAVQSDGKLLVAGTSSSAVNSAVVSKSAPTDIAISLADELSSKVVGSVMGTVTTSDPDESHAFRYALVNGPGSIDNASFRIVADTLRKAAPLPSKKAVYSIRVRSTDQTGLSFEREFSFSVNDDRPGAKDRTFNESGIVTTPVGASDDFGRSVAIHSDGRILVVGESYNGSNNDFAVVRYNTNGTLDTSFGNSGKAVLDFANTTDNPSRVAIQNVEVNGEIEERIIVAGSILTGDNYDFALARFLSNGQLDTTFGDQTNPSTQGKQVTQIVSSGDAIQALVIQPDGKILAGGFSHSGIDNDFALARYDINGTLDPTFQNSSSPVPGIVITDLGLGGSIQSNDQANDIMLQGDKIILAGFGIVGSTNDFTAVRYLSSGEIDTTFGASGTGILSTGFTGESADSARAMAMAPDGKLVLGGYTQTGVRSYFALARYSAEGIPDSSFGTDGRVTTEISDLEDQINDIEIQADGKIVAVGHARPAGTGRSSMQLVRYNANGSPDNSFDSDGKQTFSLGTHHAVATSVAVQPDGKLLVAGYSHNGSDNDFVVLRLLAGSETKNNGVVSNDASDKNIPVSSIISETRNPTDQASELIEDPAEGETIHHMNTGGAVILTSLPSSDEATKTPGETTTANPAGENSVVEIREPLRTRGVHSVSIHEGNVSSICYAGVGDDLLSIGEDGSLKRSVISSNTSVMQVGNSAKAVDFLNDHQMVIEESDPQATKLIEIGSLSRTEPGTRVSQAIPLAWWTEISPATQTVYSLTAAFPERTAGIMKWSPGMTRSIRIGPPGSVAPARYNRYAVAPDESILAVVAEKLIAQNQVAGYELVLWDLRRKNVTKRQDCEFPYELIFSPDCETLALVADGFLTLFNAATGEENSKVRCPDFQDLAFSPDSTEIAIVSEDRTLQRWRIDDGSEISTVEAHEIAARGVAYSPDGRTIGTVGNDGYFRCWRVDVMEATMELPLGTPLQSIRFSPNSRAAAIIDTTGRGFLLTSE